MSGLGLLASLRRARSRFLGLALSRPRIVRAVRNHKRLGVRATPSAADGEFALVVSSLKRQTRQMANAVEFGKREHEFDLARADLTDPDSESAGRTCAHLEHRPRSATLVARRASIHADSARFGEP
jgi:hypothetical protein